MVRFIRAGAVCPQQLFFTRALLGASCLLFGSFAAAAAPAITSISTVNQTSALYADFINEPNDPPNVIPGLPASEWNDNNWSELSSPIVNGKSGIASKVTVVNTASTFSSTQNFITRARAGSVAINLRLWTTPKYTTTANITATGGWIATIQIEAGSQIYKHNSKTQVSASDVTTTITGGTVVGNQNANLLIASSNAANGSYKSIAGNKTLTVRGVGNAALQVTMSQQFKLRMAAGDSGWVWSPGDSGRGCIFGGMSLSQSLSDIDCTAPDGAQPAPFGFKVTGTIEADTDSDGIPDSSDNCPEVNNVNQQDTDGDGQGDVCDPTPNGDDDGDGVDNSTDNCPQHANPHQTDWDLDGTGDACDDTDGDGINDEQDNCRLVANAQQEDLDGDGIGDACDTDIDGDGIMNHVDNCVRTPNTNQADWNGNGVGDACDDTDGDGITDDQDPCPQDPQNNCLNNPGGDYDGDGHNNGDDNCPTTANPGQEDVDGNGVGDACDDADGDGYDDDHDNCPQVANPTQADWNNNGIGDACEDSDGDGINDDQDVCREDKDNNCLGNPGGDFDGDGKDNGSDNCPQVANPDQADWNNNGVGDACEDSDGDGVNDDTDICPADAQDNCLENPDGDRDNDGVNNGDDNCPEAYNPGQVDWNDNGIGDACDDTDGDGIPDGKDICREDPSDNCLANGDGDFDGDGVKNSDDNCPSTSNSDHADWNNNGIGDACEDSDGDGSNDDDDICPADATDTCVENPNADTDGDGVNNGSDNCPLHANPDQADSDGDGIGDACDPVTDGDDGQDPDPGVLMRSWGELPKDVFGSALAAGDVNGDGYIDVVVGAPKWSKPQAGTVKGIRGVGRVYIYSGKTGLLLRTIDGEAKDDGFGQSVAVADLDFDGIAEVIVGAPKADASSSLKDSGKLYVFAGADGALLASKYGSVRAEQFGARVLALGGDRIAVSAPRAKVAALAQAGYVDILTLDSETQQLRALNRVQGNARAQRLGDVISAVADFTGDSYPELAVGLPKAAQGSKLKTGVVQIFSTAADASSAPLFSVSGAQLPSTDRGAARSGDLFGSSIAAVADMDGDGVAELLIGAPGFDAVIAGKRQANAGAAFVLSSGSVAAGEVQWLGSYYGEMKADQFGWAVADGAAVAPGVNFHFISARGADTTIKHPKFAKQVKAKDAGAVYGYLAGAQQWSLRRHGKAPKAYYGNMLVNAGDFNGDGYSDVISASAFMSRVSSITRKWIRNTGFVEVYSGESISGQIR